MLALGSERRVKLGGYQHLYDRLLGPAVKFRIEPCLVHVSEARSHDDTRRQVIPSLGQDRELRQLRQGDVHPEGRAFALPVMHPEVNVGVYSPLWHKPVEQELRVYASNDRVRAPRLPTSYDAARLALVDDDLLDRHSKQNVDALLTG